MYAFLPTYLPIRFSGIRKFIVKILLFPLIIKNIYLSLCVACIVISPNDEIARLAKATL